MVGPSITDDDREVFLLKFRIGFALLVGVSMALIALNGSTTPRMIVGAGLGGTAVGAVVGWWVFPKSIALGFARGR